MDKNNIPLIVDLDHTLIDTDLLMESSKGVLGKSPWLIFHYLYWLSKGKGYLKDQLVRRFEINIAELPFNETVIAYIQKKRKLGDTVILATASHKNYAYAVAKHLKIFDDVMASNKDFNLSSHNKAEKLIQRFGEGQFDYMGDHMRDLPVWEASNLAIIVNATKRIINNTGHIQTFVLSKKGSPTPHEVPQKPVTSSSKE
jgi:phosphoserine phosphatase